MTNIDYKFVDENATIITGEDAKKIVEIHGDSKYLGENGILSVSKERWETAQKYERSEWMVRAAAANDGRNVFHRNVFKKYECLDGIDATSFAELGCGPFTNARMILDKFPNVEEVTLLDPLVNDYLEHQYCKYKSSCRGVGKTLELENGESIKANLVSSSIENYDTDETFDVVVMINVLEHCFDIPKIFNCVDRMLNVGGVFIYADVQFDIETVKEIAKFKYNAGHPLRPTKQYVNKFLDEKFEQIFSRTFDEEVAGLMAEERYFIGKKL